MNDAMIVEAVRSATAAGGAASSAAAPQQVANPASVAKFNAAMAATAPAAVDPVPFASEVAASWRLAQANNQGILHRIEALSAMSAKEHALSSAELVELQYEVANLSFQQEVVTKVANQASNAIQTLVKNQ